MQAPVTVSQKARSRAPFLSLLPSAGRYCDPRCDSVAVGLRAEQVDGIEGQAMAAVISQQARCFVHVIDKDIDIAVVIKVSKSQATAGVARNRSRAGNFGHIFHLLSVQIAVENGALVVGGARNHTFDLRVNVSIDHENVGPAVIVIIEKADAPSHVLRVFLKPSGADVVLKRSVAIIVIEISRIFDEVGFHKIEIAVAVKVAGGRSHASLFASILAIGDAARYAHVSKSAVAIVVIEDA